MKVINFPNLAKNTFPHIEKYLTLGGMKLPGSKLHLIHWRKKKLFCLIWKNIRNSANPTSSPKSRLFTWEKLCISLILYHAMCWGSWRGRGYAGPQPCPCHTAEPFTAPSVPRELEQSCLFATCGLLLFRNKIWSSSFLFFHPLFNHSLKYLVGKIYEKTKQVCWSSISPLSWVCFFLSVLVPNPAKYILTKISYVKHENRQGNV